MSIDHTSANECATVARLLDADKVALGYTPCMYPLRSPLGKMQRKVKAHLLGLDPLDLWFTVSTDTAA